jgi:hypothetical protein
MNTPCNRGVTFADICFYGFLITMCVACAIAMIVGSTRVGTMAKIGTDDTSDTWKTSKNMTPSGSVSTYIITDPSNGQKWLAAQGSSGVSIIPYVPAEVKAEKETK